ncbi:MAG: hypothetical protein Q7R31_03405 [Candidatus Levybacteria bacterium]|nr:hypothetical protein [Candidatus Levybacteria bacterium]
MAKAENGSAKTELEQGAFFEPHSEAEKIRNSNIAGGLKVLFNQEGRNDRKHVMILTTLSHRRLLGDPAAIFVLESKNDGFPKISAKNALNSPLYALTLNSFPFLFTNRVDGKIYKIYIQYLFNESGQGVKRTKIVEAESLNPPPRGFKSRHPRISIKPDIINVFMDSSIKENDYSLVEKWLKGIETGEIIMTEAPPQRSSRETTNLNTNVPTE